MFSNPLNESNYSKYFPILTPAIEEYKIDNYLLFNRILSVALIALTSIAVAIAIKGTAICFTAFFLGAGLVTTVAICDTWLSKRALDKIAVDDYLKSRASKFKRCQLIWITSNIKAAQLFLDCANTNQIQEIIDDISDFNVFKLFVDHTNIDFRFKIRGTMYFQKILEHHHPDFLEYLLKSGKVKADLFTLQEQFNFWTQINTTPKKFHLLKEFGFDVNVRNASGYTPLFHLMVGANTALVKHITPLVEKVTAHSIHLFLQQYKNDENKKFKELNFFIDNCKLYSHLKILLECGADTRIEINSIAYDIASCSIHPIVIDALNAHSQALQTNEK